MLREQHHQMNILSEAGISRMGERRRRTGRWSTRKWRDPTCESNHVGTERDSAPKHAGSALSESTVVTRG